MTSAVYFAAGAAASCAVLLILGAVLAPERRPLVASTPRSLNARAFARPRWWAALALLAALFAAGLIARLLLTAELPRFSSRARPEMTAALHPFTALPAWPALLSP